MQLFRATVPVEVSTQREDRAYPGFGKVVEQLKYYKTKSDLCVNLLSWFSALRDKHRLLFEGKRNSFPDQFCVLNLAQPTSTQILSYIHSMFRFFFLVW